MDRTVAGIVGDQPARLEPVTEGSSSTASMDPQQLWQVAQEELRFQVVRPGYEAWLANAVLIESDGHTFTVGVPTIFARDWVSERYVPIDPRDAVRGARPRLRGRDHRRPGGVAAARGAAAPSRPDVRACRASPRTAPTTRGSIRTSPSAPSSSATRRVSRMRHVARSPRRPARRTTRCSCTAAWVSARPISCTRSDMRCARRIATRRSRTSRPRNS